MNATAGQLTLEASIEDVDRINPLDLKSGEGERHILREDWVVRVNSFICALGATDEQLDEFRGQSEAAAAARQRELLRRQNSLPSRIARFISRLF